MSLHSYTTGTSKVQKLTHTMELEQMFFQFAVVMESEKQLILLKSVFKCIRNSVSKIQLLVT